MSVRSLKKLFHPQSVAIVGASNAAGTVVMRNLLQGGFTGPIMPVHPDGQAVQGVFAYKNIHDLPRVPDMAVLCVPPEELPEVIERLGERHCPAAVVITTGLDRLLDRESVLLAQVLERARTAGMRLLGPSSQGIMVPKIGLNASFAPQPVLPGRIAFVSQSDALCAAVLDWAIPKGIGFSHFISLGRALETGLGDVLDYLGSDPQTRAILLYIESIDERRNFMSAARAAARNKPVLAIKAGRSTPGARAAQSHTGQMAGSDLVYDAAMRRAGMLRVYAIEDLFVAVETLSASSRPKGDRLAILTNGGGVAVMAVDELVDLGGSLATLGEETRLKLDAVLPQGWSRENPIDIMDDASGNRYADALNVLVHAKEIDSILVMHTPVATASPSDIADKVIAFSRHHKRCNITSCWVGDHLVAQSRRAFHAAGIPTFDTPRQAVQAFMHTIEYRRNQDLLMETPPSLPTDFTANTAMARLIVKTALREERSVLSDPEAKAILSAYGIPTVETHIARTPDECHHIAKCMGGPVALKILSPDINHKSDHGGVRLNIETPGDCQRAAEHMVKRVQDSAPSARLEGFTVQRMKRHTGAHELIVGVATDPIFGPVILFGQGGTAVEVIGDRAVALPPLNMALAAELIARTRVSKVLKGYRSHPAADHQAICLTLIQVAQLIVDIPEIIELDINPLFADDKGVVALDARMSVHPTGLQSAAERLAIRPYPAELEESFTIKGERDCLLRPIRPEDEPNHHNLLSRLTPEDVRFRFFGLVHELPHDQMARLTQIDYDREMAFVAIAPNADGTSETLGAVRAVTDPDNEVTEFAIVVRSDLKGSGLARQMMKKMIRYCRDRNTQTMVGQVLKDNSRMLHFVEGLGFRKVRTIDTDVVEVKLNLQTPLIFS